MVAYLQKSEGSEGFHEIIDFLSASHISYALTENPTIYVSFIKQFWSTAATSTRDNGELEDNGGVTSLPNSEIFEQLALMGYVTDSDKLTFPKATAIICLATNRTYNFSKMIFDAMVKNVDSPHKFLMYPRVSKGYSGVEVPLFPTMLNEPTTSPSRITSSPSLSPKPSPSPQHTTTSAPSTSQPQHSQPLAVIEEHKNLEQTKKTYNTDLTKLILKVKKLENKLKSGKARQELGFLGEASDDTEVLVQEETPTKLVEDKSSGEKGEKEVTTPANYQTFIRSRRGVSTGNGDLSVDEELARKIYEEDQARAIAEQKQEMINFEAALELQRQLDERQEVPTQTQEIDWNDPSVLRRKSLARKRERETLDEETFKKQKHDEEEISDYEEEELRLNLKIVPNEDDEVYYEPLSKKYPIVDFEYQLLGRMEAKDMDVYKLTRSSSYHGCIQAFLRILNKQDLDNLYSLVQERFRDHLLEGHDLLL
ncbi:hypothetical protein Tco_1057163 [Tanacetum coccineum]|uniref:Xylulose kinase-1 n=1 Tax=Tanacetum coccineum TaxID=301880 RepID=A0ABQ5H4R0_9ASTR